MCHLFVYFELTFQNIFKLLLAFQDIFTRIYRSEVMDANEIMHPTLVWGRPRSPSRGQSLVTHD